MVAHIGWFDKQHKDVLSKAVPVHQQRPQHSPRERNGDTSTSTSKKILKGLSHEMDVAFDDIYG